MSAARAPRRPAVARRVAVPVAVAGWAAAAVAWRRYLASLAPELGGEPMRATTDDGWHLGMSRYRVPAGTERRGVVVAGHGFAGTSLIWDLAPSVSLARYLAVAGWEFFSVDLRGRGSSWPVGGPSPRLQWSFDDLVDHDLPTAVAAACDAAEVDRACVVGLEMSGQALYAALADGTVPQVCAGVTLGAPAVTPPGALVPGVTSSPQLRMGGRVLLRPGARHAGPVLALLRSQQLASSFRPELVDPLVPARYLRHGVPDESVVLADQFADWVEHATMRSLDHRRVWSDRLGDVDVPLLLLAGAADLQRPPDAVRATAEALGSAEARFRELGVSGGLPADHGHDDVVGARTAPRDVYPLVLDWLDRHG